MSLYSLFSRLNFHQMPKATRSIHCCGPSLIRVSLTLNAEPLKKKKKIDPMIIKQREEKKKRRLEKQIRRLEKNARQLKPIDELEVPLEIIDQREERLRAKPQITAEENEKRATLLKEWARYKHNEKISDFLIIDRVINAQQKALFELKNESEELYQEAIQKDLNLMYFTVKGPVSTPPIEMYNSPDGEYIDKTKKWD